ncbi:MAG: penicillin-binding protein 2, partial [Novosphingobium sp.]|nr:penicillin-binding protein 2 [Novosphingobium sp.]
MSAITVSTTISSGRRQIVNVRQHTLLMAKWRVLWVLVVFAAIAVSAMGRIAYLGVFQPVSHAASMFDALLPDRGDIVDRNGVPLARAFNAYSLWYNPAALGKGTPLVRPSREIARELVAIFPDLDEDELTGKLNSGKPGYLRRRILPEHANRIHDLGEPALEFPRE